MKPLTKEQQIEAIRLVRTLVQKIEKYSVSHAVNYKTTPQHRLHDAIALADITVVARDFSHDLAHEDLVASMAYQTAIYDGLTKGPNATRESVAHYLGPANVITDLEMEEIREAYDTGVPVKDILQVLVDRDIATAERAAENPPSDGGMSDRDRQHIIDAGRGHLVQ